ncbi:unknown protein [Simkania negevensis Z]|uniref:Uncharacterized protein n=1 Tax=Simkania negevensis (strain ATCC VR-1471 / DSM 27360 / Z) TaxID=331113 RepID=F8L682_SIMNZ|nr:unknown protein [Simkania negevensis Z]
MISKEIGHDSLQPFYQANVILIAYS